MNLTEVIIACVCWALLVQVQAQQLIYAFSRLHHWHALGVAYLVLVNVRELYQSKIPCSQIQPLFGGALVYFTRALNQASLQVTEQGTRCSTRITWQEGHTYSLTQVV